MVPPSGAAGGLLLSMGRVGCCAFFLNLRVDMCTWGCIIVYMDTHPNTTVTTDTEAQTAMAACDNRCKRLDALLTPQDTKLWFCRDCGADWTAHTEARDAAWNAR